MRLFLLSSLRPPGGAGNVHHTTRRPLKQIWSPTQTRLHPTHPFPRGEQYRPSTRPSKTSSTLYIYNPLYDRQPGLTRVQKTGVPRTRTYFWQEYACRVYVLLLYGVPKTQCISGTCSHEGGIVSPFFSLRPRVWLGRVLTARAVCVSVCDKIRRDMNTNPCPQLGPAGTHLASWREKRQAIGELHCSTANM